MAHNPTLLDEATNSLGQTVRFYEHPLLGDESFVIAVIEQTACHTDFFDTSDFFEGSDYMPVLVNGQIICEFER